MARYGTRDEFVFINLANIQSDGINNYIYKIFIK